MPGKQFMRSKSYRWKIKKVMDDEIRKSAHDQKITVSLESLLTPHITWKTQATSKPTETYYNEHMHIYWQ
jgi:hypothetical protein